MALRSALTRTGLARAVCSSGLGGFGQVAPAMGASRAGVAQPLAPSAAAAAFTTSAHRGRNLVETEVFDRSRQEIILGNRMPSVACDSWVAPNATLIGDTDIAGQCCVWHGSVLKGDLGAVRLGMFSNVMEKCVIDAAGCVELSRHQGAAANAAARPSRRASWSVSTPGGVLGLSFTRAHVGCINSASDFSIFCSCVSPTAEAVEFFPTLS